MLVLFKPYPQSIVRAYVASRVHKAKPVEETDGGRFYFEEHVDADALDYDSIYSQHKEAFGGLDFLEDEKLNEILEDEIFWASRFNQPDRFQLIFSVLLQIERTGTKAYLAQQSPEAKEMKDRVRRVTGEFRRAKQFLTFAEDAANRAMVGKGSFEHLIADLVLRHFAKRYPGHAIAVLDDEHAHICYMDEILVDARKRFPERPGRKDAARYWSLLSDPKNLEARRDRAYPPGQLPRNYWKWVAEGTQPSGQPPRATLDDFMS
ncbi:MAG: hypothetical protein A3K67_01780 [Euryarchaeota archaeon RBG_16_62_10]|nr:MAG: hypothetical protein A3K67_01780 [Euryarchaeota archaeon RBG_16_62_10]